MMAAQPDPDMLAAALAAHDAGLCIVRAATNGTKKPLGTWKHHQSTRPTRHDIETWFAGGHTGMGVVCGAVSGDLEMLELEGRFMATHATAWMAAVKASGLELLFQRLRSGLHTISPSDGRHFFYRIVDGPADGNTKLAVNDQGETLIETRGEGGFVILAPSHGTTHPTGRPWSVKEGGFDRIPAITAAERDTLFDVARTFNTHTPTAPPATTARIAVQPLSGRLTAESWQDATAGHIAAERPLQALLEAYGWQHSHQDGHGRTLMTRPGKTEGVSGSINSNGRLMVFSTSTPFPTGRTTYDHIDVIAHYEHGGDRQAAMRDLAERTGILAAWQQRQDADTSRTFTALSAPSAPAPRPADLNLPDDFWTARPSLAHIRQAAHARSRSADAVLVHTLGRVAALIHPTVRLPAIVGGIASLNYLGAVVGASGTGKSSAGLVARNLVPIDRKDVVADIPLGSGEGLVEMYFEKIAEPGPDGKTRIVKRHTKSAVHLTVDEGQVIGEMGNRKGSVLLPILRTAWSGDTLGQTNASEDTRRQLAAHSYRLAVVAGFQPEHAGPLIADAAGGTPQRFLFAVATDPNLTADRPAWPGTLELPTAIDHGRHGVDIDVHPDIARRIIDRDLAVNRGDITIDPLDAHRELLTLKVAAILAWIDGGRYSIHPDDHQLACQIMDVSDRVRSWVIAVGAQQVAADEAAQTRRLVTRARAAADDAESKAIISGAKSIARRVHKVGGTVPLRDIRHAVAGKHRDTASLDEMIEHAESEGWIVAVDGGWTAGESRPA